MSKISVRFLFDKEKKRVVCAEAGSDFIDVLFSFLTLPLGSIVQLLGTKSELGSLDTLYEGVEQLDDQHFKTEACKGMLLDPRSAAAIICEDLKIKNIHDDHPMTFYVCFEDECLVQSTCYYTYINNRCIRCGKLITRGLEWVKKKSDEGIFVNKTTDFMITDNLWVMPTSLMRGYSLLEELGIENARNLETRAIDFDTEEMLNLLRRALVSQNPLTEICFSDVQVQASVNCSSAIKEEMNADEGESEVSLKLIVNKKNNKVLYAEGGEDFMNQLLSFLTFPLGAVLRILSDNASVSSISGCIGNLYSSVESIGLDCFKEEDCKNILLNPKLSTFYGFEKQMLKLDEITSKELSVSGGCLKCYAENGFKPCIPSPCKHGLKQSKVIEQNPKSGEVTTMDNGGGFVIGSKRFMIADNLQISPLSFISAIDGHEMNFAISDLVEKTVCVDKAKVLSLLSAMLISKTVLTDVFCRKSMQRKRSQSRRVLGGNSPSFKKKI